MRKTNGLDQRVRRGRMAVACLVCLGLLGCQSPTHVEPLPMPLSSTMATADSTTTTATAAPRVPMMTGSPHAAPPDAMSKTSSRSALSRNTPQTTSPLVQVEREIETVVHPTPAPRRRELLLEFHPHFVLYPTVWLPVSAPSAESPTEPGFSGVAQSPAQPTPPQPSASETANPLLATVNNRRITASMFVERAFRMHHDWYWLWLKERFVERISAIETKREGIELSPAEIDSAHHAIVEFLKQRARTIGQSWEQHWRGLGYATEAAYLEALKEQTPRLLRLEQLVLLQDIRLTKVEYSIIVIPNRVDRFNPDPAGKAKRIADDIRNGDMSWAKGVEHSSDVRTRDRAGKVGVVVKGMTPVQELERFLFSARPGDISEPIADPFNGFVIARVDRVIPGRPNVSYAEVKEELQKRLAAQQGIPGVRVTSNDTFMWLERLLASKAHTVQSFTPHPADGSPMVALVNGAPVSDNELVEHAFLQHPDWARQVLSEVLMFTLADLESQREGVEIPAAAVKAGAGAVWDLMAANARSRAQNPDSIWQGQGYSAFADFSRLVLEPLARETMVIERLVLLHDRRVERRDLSHILCQSQERAKEAEAELRAGKPFDKVAAAYSQHAPTRKNGGRIGIVPKDLYSAEFTAVAFSLEVGRVSPPFVTEQGWHLVVVSKIFPARPNLTWIEAKDEIEQELTATGKIPGQRVSPADTYRWAAAAKSRHEIKMLYPK